MAPPPAERPSGAVAEKVHAFAAAGGTWWMELGDDTGGPAAYRERMRDGPPIA